jgi:hypothetical protein
MDFDGVVPVPSTPNQKVTEDIRNFLAAAGIPAADVTISITSAEGENAGQAFILSDPDNKLRLFTIEATIPFESVSSFPVTFMQGQVIKATLTMRAGNTALLD